MVPASRVDVADTLMVIADTRKLWVAAQLREQDWESLSIVPGQPWRCKFPR